MYSFAQRNDTRVFDEPLYAHYLANTDAHAYHPSSQDILNSQDNHGERVVKNVLLGGSNKPVLFFKNMAHHLVDMKLGFLDQLTNILLTRNPRDMIISYSKTIPKFGMDDLGYKTLLLLQKEILSQGQTPIVLDSQILLNDPEQVLKNICQRTGIDFDPAMLKWEAKPRPEDGVWAPHWYHNIHRSTGFQPYVSKFEDFPEAYVSLFDECQVIYESLMEYAIF